MILNDSSLFLLELHIGSSCTHDARVFVFVRFTGADIPRVKTSVGIRKLQTGRIRYPALSLKDGSDHGLIKQLGIFVAKEKIEKASKPKIEKAEKARHEEHGIWTEQTFFQTWPIGKMWSKPKKSDKPGIRIWTNKNRRIRAFWDSEIVQGIA